MYNMLKVPEIPSESELDLCLVAQFTRSNYLSNYLSFLLLLLRRKLRKF